MGEGTRLDESSYTECHETSSGQTDSPPLTFQLSQKEKMTSAEGESFIPSLAPQIKLLKHLKIFNEDEIRSIKAYRKYYKRKLSKEPLPHDVLLEYVRYELDLLAIIREKKVDDSQIREKNLVMFSSGNLLNALFGILTSGYPQEVQLWLLYVKYCREMKDNNTLVKVVETLLKVHRDKPFVFQLASRCAREDLNSLELARSYLLMGIRLHSDSIDLFKDAFAFELAVARNDYSGSEAYKPESELSKRVIERLYNAARVKIQSIHFFIDLMNSIQDLSFLDTIRSKILNDLPIKFPKEEITWDTIARIKLEQLKIPENESNFRNIIEDVINLYKTAVEQCSNSRTMWSMYIDRMYELFIDKTIKLPNFQKNSLIYAFTGASNKKQLSDKYFLIWVEMQKDEERKWQLLKTLPPSVNVWEKILEKKLRVNSEKECWKLFTDIISCFKENRADLLPLWKLMLLYYQSSHSDKVKWFFEQGILPDSGVANFLKPAYLEWTVITQGIQAGRELYDILAKTQPHSMVLHEKMIQLEGYQVKLNLKSIRKCYVLTTEQFGSSDVGPWMRYIQFENDCGKSKKKILSIRDKAVQNLQHDLLNGFTSEMALFEIACLASPKNTPLLTESSHSSFRSTSKTKASSSNLFKCEGSKSKRLCIKKSDNNNDKF